MGKQEPIWERRDGDYRVAVYERWAGTRTRYEVRAYRRGDSRRADRESTASRREAITGAETQWEDWLAGRVLGPDQPPETVGEAVDRFCDRTTTRTGRALRPETGRAYRSQLAGLVKIAGRLPPRHLGKRHVYEAAAAPAAVASRASYLRAMRALCRWMRESGYIDGDPTDGITIDTSAVEMRPMLAAEDLAPFLAACPPAHALRAALILETGLRASEAAHARWDWIIRGTGRPSLRVPAHDAATGWQTKGRRARAIPLSATAQWIVGQCRAAYGPGPFLLHDGRGAHGDRPADPNAVPRTDNWRDDTRIACERVNAHRAAMDRPLPPIPVIDTHGLRRTAGMRWLLAGIPLHVVSRLLGHRSVTTTERHYAGYADDLLGEHMGRMD